MPPVKFAIGPRFRRKSLVSGWKLGYLKNKDIPFPTTTWSQSLAVPVP
jgi:hypothetical protein